ncbi:MAG: outer membrane efflux protein [Candidatus Saganbacteria bacterium]|uniref:Outer membrane efflux protein n=1 Tax=Candidatus Saganbacteria bacterium TaxID=2575572 RepID=A0A833L1E0_UNCSA|nr:MAG: outer membrane efflux protein [Candidatus Saganbacteria bacterium]
MRLIIPISFLCFLLSLPAFSLTWPEAKDLADKNNEQLSSARLQLETSNWQYRRSFSPFLPQLSASAGMSESSSVKSYSYGLSASQSLFQGMSNYYGLQSAFANLKYYESSLNKIESDVYYEVRGAYVDLIIAKQTVALQEQILKLRRKNEELISMLYKNGKEDIGNNMQAKADVLDAEFSLNSAKRALLLICLKLSQLLSSKIEDADKITEVKLPAKSDFENLLTNSPSYLMLKYKLEAAEAERAGKYSEVLPSVSLSGSWRKSGSEWLLSSSSKSWSLNISYSIFSGGSNIADLFIAGSTLEKAKKDFSSGAKDLRYALESAYIDLANAVDAVKVKKSLLSAAEERAKISRVKYINGLINYDEWDRVENLLISAQKAMLNQQKSALIAEAAYFKSFGGNIK